ncbi:YifB family Mg chelatase-like AAA ATPase [Hyphomicrobium zavarzinii]|jgi:magnesium chelatase family protein|uniref:YifB family Mg chelatase-like AAA ATPase n=1 Tax=Hyphomicrobium zavarzinii TaxID=48292 RepID=UPI0003757901|nr:YifB family Mg chelatase-like AAA ATPase [Hyphomicrobium zavarzinii]HML44706.1 YifB family Mg chelatase-like AAA ATPase [Hyphomicrobium zavarzinii]
MYGTIATVAFVGVEARAVEVQVRITPGQQTFAIVGLPDKAVAESRERVRNALHAVGLGLPYKHITVNLAPADLPKEGSHFDLAIVLALMVAMEAVAPDAIERYAAIGELALDGSIRSIPGALPAAIGASAMGKGLICPQACGSEAAWAGEDADILAAPHLLSLVNHFKGLQTLSRPKPALEQDRTALPDLRDVRGQESAKRALEVAAAGGHNLLMIGPPGSGKSMLAARLPSILPPLTPEEMLDVSMVHSLAGELMGGKLCTERPFRAPHHSASMAALVGGGTRPRPGEASLAHLGVLFLDELPEFQPAVLDALRQPLETGELIIARANHRIAYPARMQLVAAMNPCRCGGGAGQSCKRGPRCAADYQARISGPMLDRIDIQIEVPAVSAADLVLPPPNEGSAEVRARVTAARERQRARFLAHGAPKLRTNSECTGHILEKTAEPDQAGITLIRQAAETLKLSARGFHRTLRVARTLADLDGAETVGRIHIAEALSYRGETLRQERVA